jgi:hypothetical protein
MRALIASLLVQSVRCCDDVTAFCRGEFYGSQLVQMTHGPVNTTRTRKAAPLSRLHFDLF